MILTLSDNSKESQSSVTVRNVSHFSAHHRGFISYCSRVIFWATHSARFPSKHLNSIQGNIMHRVFFSSALALISGILISGHGDLAIADPLVTTPKPASLMAQEPNQDNLQMTCTGSIGVNDVDYSAFFTREAGFSRIEFRRRSSGQLIAETFLSFDQKNDKGQAIWRGGVNDAASVTLVHLANRPAQPGDQISVGYDGQWGRSTCRRSN